GWTLDELKALLDKKGEGVIPFDTESKADMLSDFLSNGITDFVDWQTGDCSFDLRVKAMTATEAYVDDLGQVIEQLEQGSRYVGDLKIRYGPVSQEDVDIYVNLVNHTKKSVGFDEEMMKIVFDETKAYFAGRKSLDKTAEIIQNRVQTYVNENR
ncbi:MAG: hypothetical protein IJ801_07040, partial [Lachnospiraceae bacterium]|nr:hypothetical protein [Lachnospiraceae bacterium]